MTKKKWEEVPMEKTDKGVKIRLGDLYYYPLAENPDDRGHGYLTAPGVEVLFEDEIELLEGISRMLRRAKQIAAKP
jgi:hypothetical protein